LTIRGADLDTPHPVGDTQVPSFRIARLGTGMKAKAKGTNKALVAQAVGAFLFATLLPAPGASQYDSATVQVVRVINGDTIRVCCVFGESVKVRYEEEK